MQQKKKIAYCHQYFNKPSDTGGTRSYYIAREMISAGHEVVMITSDKSRRFDKLISTEEFEGIQIYWIRADYHNQFASWKKVLSFFKYMMVSTYVLLRLKNVDVVYATSTPLTVGIPALCGKLFRKFDYIFEVRDLWPDFPIQMGALRVGFINKLLYALERRIYKHATAIVALSPGMVSGVLARGGEGKTHMIPNMSKPLEFFPRETSQTVLDRYAMSKDSFRITYFGTMGVANNIPHLVNEALIAQTASERLQFIFVGDGAAEVPAKRFVEEKQLTNCVFLGRRNMAEVSEIVNACDVSVVSFQDKPILKTNSPNKFFDSLSAGKPCLVTINGWICDIVHNSNCGAFVDQHTPGDLVKKALQYANDPDRLRLHGENARALSENQYDRKKLCAQVLAVVEKATDTA